jgi:hypothetical protein
MSFLFLECSAFNPIAYFSSLNEFSIPQRLQYKSLLSSIVNFSYFENKEIIKDAFLISNHDKEILMNNEDFMHIMKQNSVNFG